MADAVDMREDGEIESDEQTDPEEVYTTLERPQTELKVNSSQAAYNTDSSLSSDSDGEAINKKLMKRLEKPPQTSTVSATRSKNGCLWKNMLQEETLMENLKTCDVSLKRKYERGAESYDFEAHRKKIEDEGAAAGVKFLKRRKMDVSENESTSSNGSFRSTRRAKRNNNKRNKGTPKILPEITVSLEGSDEEFSRDLAHCLEEENLDLIFRIVNVIGKDACLNFFKKTQNIESKGGMMTMNKLRRRTPGGIFLFIVKTSDKLDEDSKNEIFKTGKVGSEKGIADRKMSGEHTEAKDPPNSPANPEFPDTNGKITDPDLISQKILNFSKPSVRANEDVLELDYDDMDTF